MLKNYINCVHYGVARNFDWEGPEMETSCDVNFGGFFGNVITMTSLNWRHNQGRRQKSFQEGSNGKKRPKNSTIEPLPGGRGATEEKTEKYKKQNTENDTF